MKPLVAVLGMEDGPEAAPGPSVIGALAAGGFNTCAVGLTPFESGIWREPRASKAFSFPHPPSPKELMARLVSEGVSVVLPGSPQAALLLADAHAQLAQTSVRTPLCAPERFIELSRDGLHAPWPRRCATPLARGWNLPTEVSETNFSGEWAWPLVLTTDIGLRLRVTTAFHAVRAVQRLRTAGATRVTVIETTPSALFEVCVVTAPQGRLLGSAAVRVLADDDRERPWMCVSIDDDSLHREAAFAAAALGLGGALTLRFTAPYGLPLLTEVVYGLPHWVETSQVAGCCLAALQVRALLDEAPTAEVRVPAGLVFSACADDQTITPEMLMSRIVEPTS